MDAAAEFFGGCTKLTYKRGEVVVRAGDPPSGVFYLKEGFVRQFVLSENGEMLVTHVFKPGSFFPMWWVLNNTANRYTFEAITPAILYRAPKAEVLHFVKKHPEVLLDLTSRILCGLAGVLTRMEMLVFEDAFDKTIKFLIYYAKNVGEKGSDQNSYSITITQREIAAWIGSTRETASLQVEELKRRGLIVYKNRKITVPDIKKLEEMLKK